MPLNFAIGCPKRGLNSSPASGTTPRLVDDFRTLPKRPPFNLWLFLAEVLLVLTILFLLAATWMPITGFRLFLARFIPALGDS